MSAKNPKMRLDARLIAENFAESPKLAAALIMSGNVCVNGALAQSAGQQVKASDVVTLKGREHEWVSRGAYKLLTAAERFSLNLDGRVCLDVGASTGGFTQVMLRRGAAKVYAVDVGYGQLAWELRSDSRVVVMERQNARFLEPVMFQPLPDFAASDASFISLKLLLNPMAAVTAPEAEAVVLVKPQFEARREDVDTGGVVRSPQVHADVLTQLRSFIANETPWGLIGATWSGVKGPKGNIEYLFHLRKDAESVDFDAQLLVQESYHALNG